MATVAAYVDLIRLFLARVLSASEFEQQYLALFKGDSEPKAEPLFLILDRLFADVDAFCEQPWLRDEDDIGEEELRARCEAALDRLSQ